MVLAAWVALASSGASANSPENERASVALLMADRVCLHHTYDFFSPETWAPPLFHLDEMEPPERESVLPIGSVFGRAWLVHPETLEMGLTISVVPDRDGQALTGVCAIHFFGTNNDLTAFSDAALSQWAPFDFELVRVLPAPGSTVLTFGGCVDQHPTLIRLQLISPDADPSAHLSYWFTNRFGPSACDGG